jgi:hypothetical protein
VVAAGVEPRKAARQLRLGAVGVMLSVGSEAITEIPANASVEPFHLFRYLDEQMFRFNNRKLTNAERFRIVTKGLIGHRLAYRQLTGETIPATT